MPNIVTLGETMALIRSNIAGHQGSRSQMTLGFGGAESNLSVALTRLGNDVTWFSQLGSDAFGRMIATELRGEGINVRAITIDDAPTGLMVKTSGLAGTQDVTYYRKDSAAARINTEDIPTDLFAGADLFHTSGITLAISESAREACLATLAKAKQENVRVSFDINHRTRLWSQEEAAPFYRQALSYADIVFAGRAEAALITTLDPQSNPQDLLTSLQELTAGYVVLKEGEEGSWTLLDGNLIHVPAISISAVDTVGAGDGFAAGFLDALLKSETLDLAACLEAGNRVGAFACLNSGDWEGYPTPDQLQLIDAPTGVEIVSR